jgi:NADH-quinone oxidoreductase subunit I
MNLTNTYEMSDTRADMRNLVRTACMDSEQHAENCAKKSAENSAPRSPFTIRESQRESLSPTFTLCLPASADSAKVNGMASLIQEVGETFFTLYKGFSVTLRTMFRKTTTESFPDAPPTVQPRYRGIHVLQRDEHGYEKCVGCFLCAAACPANCIYIEAAENTAANRISAGERYAKVYNIDYSRCIFCGYCVEACPTDAITHGHSIELAPYNINALIYRKEQLLEPWPPRAKQP